MQGSEKRVGESFAKFLAHSHFFLNYILQLKYAQILYTYEYTNTRTQTLYLWEYSETELVYSRDWRINHMCLVVDENFADLWKHNTIKSLNFILVESQTQNPRTPSHLDALGLNNVWYASWAKFMVNAFWKLVSMAET